MIIVVCASSSDAQARVDSRFGRAFCFAVFDDQTDQWRFIGNEQDRQAVQGAGIQAAQTVLDLNADVLIACNVGPKAMAALQNAGVRVYQVDPNQTLAQALLAFQQNQLDELQNANVQGHW